MVLRHTRSVKFEDIAFTMDVYSHIIEGMGAEAMALLGEVLTSGINGTRKNNGNLTAKVDIMIATA